MPLFARRSYASELAATCFFSVALAMVEGAFTGVIVKRAFEDVVAPRTLNYAVALLAAAPEFTNLSSFFWARLAHARRKVRIINTLQIVTSLLVAIIALIPRSQPGLWLLAGCIIGARFLVAGIVTLRVSVWRANYARSDRARATSKLAVVQSLVIAAAGLLVSNAMNRSPDAFRFLFPVAGLLGLAGAWFYARVRLRRQNLLLKAERDLPPDHRPSLSPLSLARTLAADRNYAWFMLFMFVLGSGNLMLTAPLIITLRDEFALGYAGSVFIMQTIPLLILVAAVPLWARYLDNVHIVRFRSRHSWVFVAAQAAVLAGAVFHVLPLICLGVALLGVGYAGGTLAWNLGHLDFSPPEKAAQYMAVHLTLNGVRGFLAPLIGVYLQSRLSDRAAGHWVFAVSVVFCVLGAAGFGWLRARMGAAVVARPSE
jgi:MFS family permease